MIIGLIIGGMMIVGLWKGIQLIDEERDKIKEKKGVMMTRREALREVPKKKVAIGAAIIAAIGGAAYAVVHYLPVIIPFVTGLF